MIHAQASRTVNLLSPQSFGTSATVSATVSVVGWNYAEVTLHLATQTAANTDTITLAESDGTTYATNSDLTMTTAAPDTSNTQIYKWFLDLRKRKKNLRLQYGPAGTARIGSANIVLSRGNESPTTASLQGATGGRVIA